MTTHSRPRDTTSAYRDEAGFALMTTLMVLVLLSSLLVGFTAMVASETRLGGVDVMSADSFYAAHAGTEKLTSDLGTLFAADFSPSGDAVRAVADNAPDLDGISWFEPDGSDGYRVDFLTTTGDPATGDPVSENRTITSGPFAGFIGLVTEYTVSVTSRLFNGAESSLERVLQTVSIPVFQFGSFSETDLSYFPGPSFTVGGRIHTNGDLYLAAVAGVTFQDKITAAGEVIRTHMSNGWNTSSIFNGPVKVAKSPGSYRTLQRTEGSLVGTVGSSVNEPTWTNLSTGTYNSYITNERTGAKRLDLPLVSLGAEPIDLIRRPPVGEDPAGAIYPQRYFAKASVRILLSDTSTDITSLPTVTQAAPIRLDAQVDLGGDPLNPWLGYVVGPNNPPLAVSSAVPGDGYLMPVDTTSLGGFIKIEIQNAAGNFFDVTAEVLGLGIAGRNLNAGCVEPNPNAILRVQRLRFDGNLAQPGGTGCGDGSTDGYDYWPNVLYDAREGNLRDNFAYGQATMPLGGVMHYIELDVNNLRRWLTGSIGATGTTALDQDGFIVYFSDRRGNRDVAGNETGEYGFEDIVNPASSNGTPNLALDTGEDMNENGSLETYGQTPIVPVGALPPLDVTALPTTCSRSARCARIEPSCSAGRSS